MTIDGLDSEDYRLVLFFIKKGTRMPLHDHPNMAVMTRLLEGSMALASYDWVEATSNLARYCGTEEVTAPCTHHLNPLENNVHEFTAGPQVDQGPLENRRSAKLRPGHRITITTTALLFIASLPALKRCS